MIVTNKAPNELNWEKNPNHKNVVWYDGTEFIGAIKVNDKRSGTVYWEYDHLRISCDDEHFTLHEVGIGDHFSGWDIEDFDYIAITKGDGYIGRIEYEKST